MKKLPTAVIATCLLLGVIFTGVFGFKAIGVEQGCIATIAQGSPTCLATTAGNMTLFHINSFLGFSTAVLQVFGIAVAVFFICLYYYRKSNKYINIFQKTVWVKKAAPPKASISRKTIKYIYLQFYAA